VTGRSYENGALMQQWECLNPQTAQNQVFTLVPGNGNYELIARNSGRCVDVLNGSAENGARAQQWTCNGGPQQKWAGPAVETVGGVNYINLIAKHSGKCMDVTGASTANGAGIQQWTCNGGNQQKWTLQSVESPAPATETSINVPPGEVLHGQPTGYVSVNGRVQAGAYPVAGRYVNVNYSKETSPGTWTVMSTSHPTLNSEGAYSYPYWKVAAGNWRVRTVFPGGEGLAESVSDYRYFTIKSGYRFVWRHSGKCMTLSENSATNGKPIIQWECFSVNPADGQVFSLVPMGGAYEIKVNSTGKCVDVTSASQANGALLQEYSCLEEGQTNQLWSLVELQGQPGWFAFIAKHSGKCADVPASSSANGVQFQQWTCNWTGNQQFAIQAIS
jgi:hypothetical protein